MLEASQSWNLFGYDLRQGWYIFQASWREFLWGANSPVLPLIDETVAVNVDGGDTLYYQAGRPAPQPAGSAEPASTAVLLPDRLILAKMLVVPKAAESSLESVVAMEVQANSPFPESDTCYGWTVVGTREQGIEVQLAISSFGTIMEYIAAQLDCHDIRAHEVWAQIDDRSVVITGFGEAARQGRNRKRAIRLGLGVGYCLLALVFLFAIAAGMKYLELQQVQGIYDDAQQSAANAVKLRSELSAGKQRVATVNAIMSEKLDPHTELTRLSSLIDDTTWLAEVDIKSATIRIDGHSQDAAAVMQKLIDEPAYKEVTAPAAIRKERRSGTERFILDLTLMTASEGQ